MNHHFSENLKIVKKTFKLSDADLGDLIGVRGNTLNTWLRGYHVNYAKRSMVMYRLRELIRKSA